MPTETASSEPQQLEKRKPGELQNPFLNRLRGESAAVYLISGIRLTGTLKSFDQFCILLENNGQQQLVFKHAIATVMPEGERKPKKPKPEQVPDSTE